jgi:hypothetical protein
MTILPISALSFILVLNAKKPIDPVFNPYIDKFIAISNMYGVDIDRDKLKINFTTLLETPTIGLCLDSGQVYISRGFWKRASTTQKELVIFHELGHCVLGLSHTDTDEDIMTWYQITSFDYKRNYNEIINRYYNCKKNCPTIKYEAVE